MTIRERLNRRKRWILGPMYVGFILFIAGMPIGDALGQPPVLAVSLSGFA